MIHITVKMENTVVHIQKDDATGWTEILKMLKKTLAQASKTEVKKKLTEKGLI